MTDPKLLQGALSRAAGKCLRWFMADILDSEWPDLKAALTAAKAEFIAVGHAGRNVVTVAASIEPRAEWGEWCVRYPVDVGHAYGANFLQQSPTLVEVSPLFAALVAPV